jgi:phosphoribosylformylglycinamidine synthase
MKQKYPNEVIAPGTVIISAGGYRYRKVEPVLQKRWWSIYYINLSQDEYKLGVLRLHKH